MTHCLCYRPGYGKANPLSKASIEYNKNITVHTMTWAMIEWFKDEQLDGIWAVRPSLILYSYWCWQRPPSRILGCYSVAFYHSCREDTQVVRIFSRKFSAFATSSWLCHLTPKYRRLGKNGATYSPTFSVRDEHGSLTRIRYGHTKDQDLKTSS